MNEADHIPYTAARHVAQGKALVLAPHADDEVLGCGGAIMRHVDHGDAVVVIIATDGGYAEDVEDTASYKALRRQESLVAAAILGYGKPIFWDYPDRGLTCDAALIAKIKKAIEQESPVVLYAPSLHEIHPDHYQLALATVQALRQLPADILLAFYEVGVPLRPNCLLDISDILERKAQAIDVFTSQLARSDYKSQILGLNHFRSYTLGLGVKAAEAYDCIGKEALKRLFYTRRYAYRLMDRPLGGTLKMLMALCRTPRLRAKEIWQKGKQWILKKRSP